MLMQFLQLDNNFSLNYLYCRRNLSKTMNIWMTYAELALTRCPSFIFPELSMKADLHPKTSSSTGP